MPEPMSNAQLLTELHARSGLSWAALGRQLGTGGEFVRKVASGAKPGRNLTAAIGELMNTGRVETPAARRATRTGGLARVRARTGEPSRIPPTAFPRTGERMLYRTGSGRLGWAQVFYVNDATFDSDVRRAVSEAGRGRHRVSFRLTWEDDRNRRSGQTLGGRGGYRPRTVLDGMRREGVLDWLLRQSENHANTVAGSAPMGELVEVEVIAE